MLSYNLCKKIKKNNFPQTRKRYCNYYDEKTKISFNCGDEPVSEKRMEELLYVPTIQDFIKIFELQHIVNILTLQYEIVRGGRKRWRANLNRYVYEGVFGKTIEEALARLYLRVLGINYNCYRCGNKGARILYTPFGTIPTPICNRCYQKNPNIKMQHE